MKKTTLKKLSTAALAAVMALSMAQAAFAAPEAQPYEGAASDSTQDISTDVATTLVSKTLTVNQAGKFPAIENFTFRMTPVAGFKVPNADTDKSGSATNPAGSPGGTGGAAGMSSDTFTKKAIPAPTPQTTDGSVSINNAGSDNWYATIKVGSFRNTGNLATYVTGATNKKIGAADSAQNKVTGDGSVDVGNPSQGSVTESATSLKRTRITPVDIRYDTAGYYVYKLEELDSESEAGVPGVYYDDHTYYIVVYVANKTDASGNTVDGVYVRNITAWRNDSARGTDYRPNLSDLAEIADVHGTTNPTAGSGEDTLKENNRGNDATQYEGNSNPPGDTKPFNARGSSDTSEGNLGKVGKGVNILPPNFWNDQYTRDLLISNNVVGNLGDRTKEFEYIVKLTGLEKNHTYTTNVAAKLGTGVTIHDDTATEPVSAKANTSAGADMIGGTAAMALPAALASAYPGVGTCDTAGKAITTDAAGNATFLVKLKDDERIVLNALPVTSRYTVVEVPSDHVASLKMNSYATGDKDKNDNNVPHKPYYATGSATQTGTVKTGIVVNTKDNTSCPTAEETTDITDGSVAIDFTNERRLATVTGLGSMFYPLAVSAAVLLAALASYTRRRRSTGIEEF